MKTLKLFTILLFATLLASCSDDTEINNPGGDPFTTDESTNALGWFGDENLGSIPVSISFGFSNSNLPSNYDITDKFPPIGNQNPYGTCVAWAVGYNAKTALSGIQKNLSPSQLASPSNQFSPKDLFMALPDNQKGAECNGTNFEFALDLLQNRGIATMASVPYTNLGQCFNSNVDPAWTTEANNYKIKHWRKVDGNVNAIKENIANNIPVILGAKLADNFMNWNSNDVMTSHSSFAQVGIHAYHAMVIAGYDDNKGPNGAFRVINSWGESWGDFGYIWIDYNFLINEFGITGDGQNSLFVMTNQDGEVAPPDDSNNPTAQGVDMASWIFSDYSTADWTGNRYSRELEFNIYNIGSETAKSTNDWDVYYLYYNAYDANDYGIMFYDQFNTSIQANTWQCPTARKLYLKRRYPSLYRFCEYGFWNSSVTRSYNVPNITGEYYLVMIADGGNVFNELNEQDNFFYTSLDPLYFDAGYALTGKNSGSEFNFKNNTASNTRSKDVLNNQFNDAQKGSYRNAYTVDEIKEMLNKEKATGRFDQKVAQYEQSNKTVQMYK